MIPVARFAASALRGRAFASIPKLAPVAYDDSIANGANALYIESLYCQWKANPAALDSSWHAYFGSLDAGTAPPKTPVSGKALRDAATDARLSMMRDASAGTTSTYAPAASCSDTMALANLWYAYQSRGHECANLDPLGLYLWRGTNHGPNTNIPELDPTYHGFQDSDLDRELNLEGSMGGIEGGLKSIIEGDHSITLKEILERLRKSYCGSIGVEYVHVLCTEKQNWVRKRVEHADFTLYSKEKKMKNYERLVDANEFELFLGKKFKTTKRFGVDGMESFIPGMKSLIDRAAEQGTEDFVISMAHRGRLNMLANVLQKPMAQVMCEFQDTHYDVSKLVSELEAEDWSSTGDVKYHLGTSSKRRYGDGKAVTLTLEANPSHLETVNPIALGRTRAKQFYKAEPEEGKLLENVIKENLSRVFPIVIHGDAAFAGQGVNYETLQMAAVSNFNVGGTVHIVLNNQVGFTTNPWDSRSTMYCSDLGKAFDVPIFHINADDTFAVCKAFEMAADYRMKFKTDVIIDLIGFRRFGHNEIDNPDFTQPVLYKKIREHPTTEQITAKKMVEDGTCSQAEIEAILTMVRQKLETALEESKTWKPEETAKEWVATHWEGFTRATARSFAIPSTGVSEERLREVGTKLCRIPEELNLHNIVVKQLKQRQALLQQNEGIDWGFAEALAYGTLLTEGYHIRLTGQDIQRGTFSHRHAVVTNQKNDHQRYSIFNNINPNRTTYNKELSRRETDGVKKWDPSKDQATAVFQNSILSEYGVLGFELGYSYENPYALVCWEAQFGDFANTAQVIIDQFIASGEHKWMQQTGLVMMLPHGYDGQGAEHSSCRLERFLQLADDDEDDAAAMVNVETTQPGWVPQALHANMCIVNLSTPANYFHVLRRQCMREFRKPLIICSPKKLLRFPACRSDLSEFGEGSTFQRLLDERDPSIKPENVNRLVFCSGQIYYDLIAERSARKLNNVAIVTIESISPFPFDRVKEMFVKYNKVDHGDGVHPGNVVWCQEEPKNNGAWSYVRPRMVTTAREGVDKDTVIRYAGRRSAAAPATGLAKLHHLEQKAVVETALLGHDDSMGPRASALLGHTT
eukprot:GEMP01001486.1.p1 GENE.GEMP01001486.1~~GEMP01001486.1.p1  ORF type:complete len:1088 (-),score=241.82 GEMP01001486.1:2086-5349(-)